MTSGATALRSARPTPSADCPTGAAAEAGRPQRARLRLRLPAGSSPRPLAGPLAGGGPDRVEREQPIERRFDLAALADRLLQRRPLAPEDRLHPPADALAGGPVVLAHEVAIQLLGHVVRRSKPPVGIAGERAHRDRVQLGRNVRAQRARRLDRTRADGIDRRGVGARVEQAGAGQALPQRDAEAEDVGAAIDRLALDLLRRAVAVLALEHAGDALLLLGAADDAEIEQLHDAVVGDEDVARADVAVDEPDRLAVTVARLVRVVQALRRLLCQRGGDLDRHAAVAGSRR